MLVLLADCHSFLVVHSEEFKVLVGLNSLSAVLAHVKHCGIIHKKNKHTIQFNSGEWEQERHTATILC